MKEQQPETVRRILDAATRVFAEVGFSGARIGEIAKLANVNVAAIYYHIGGKKELYAQVLQDYFGDTVEQAIVTIREADSPEEKLRIYIQNVAKLVEQNPYIAPIILRELASGGQHLSDVVVQTFIRLIRTLTAILKEGDQQEIFRPTMAPVVDWMIFGTFLFLNTKDPLIARYQGTSEEVNAINDSLVGDITKEVERLIIHALKKEGEQNL